MISLCVSNNDPTNLSRGEEVASLDCFKDEGVEVRLSWEMGLRQRLFHLLDLYQTQGPILSWKTHQTHTCKIKNTINLDHSAFIYTPHHQITS